MCFQVKNNALDCGKGDPGDKSRDNNNSSLKRDIITQSEPIVNYLMLIHPCSYSSIYSMISNGP